MVMVDAGLLDVLLSAHPDSLSASLLGLLALVKSRLSLLAIDVDLRRIALEDLK